MNTPEIRFKGYTNAWVQRKLGEVVERVTRKNTKLESTLPLTISAQYGLIDQNDFFNKQVASKDVSGYFLVKNGEFAYNKSYSNGYPWGAIKRLDKYDMGVLSTLYIVFNPTDVNSEFLAQYYETTNWHIQVSACAAEGARNHGLLNISPSDFFNTNLMSPQDEPEQTAIGSFFRTLDTTIALHQRKLDGLRRLKKAYLQQMFPQDGERVPRVRFAGFSGEWETEKIEKFTFSYSGGTPLVGKSEYYSGEIPFIRSAEINSSTTELFITEKGLNSSSAKMVDVGDILYALYGATSGEVGRSQIRGAVNQAILVIKPTEENDSEFLAQWLRKNKDEITKTYLQGGQGNLSGDIVKNLNVAKPLKFEQTAIGEFFATLDKQIANQSQKLEQLKQLKSAYLQKMFV